jgi:hypothetical protein
LFSWFAPAVDCGVYALSLAYYAHEMLLMPACASAMCRMI